VVGGQAEDLGAGGRGRPWSPEATPGGIADCRDRRAEARQLRSCSATSPSRIRLSMAGQGPRPRLAGCSSADAAWWRIEIVAGDHAPGRLLVRAAAARLAGSGAGPSAMSEALMPELERCDQGSPARMSRTPQSSQSSALVAAVAAARARTGAIVAGAGAIAARAIADRAAERQADTEARLARLAERARTDPARDPV
jgi:hypothetical protein